MSDCDKKSGDTKPAVAKPENVSFLIRIILDRYASDPAPPLAIPYACASFQKKYEICMMYPESACFLEYENLLKCVRPDK